MEDLSLISRGLYIVLCENMGTEKAVDMRRRVMTLQQNLNTSMMGRNKTYEDNLLSGSKGEGFRLSTSDDDWMLIRRGIRVVFPLPVEHQNEYGGTLLMAERNTTKPGFVLLRLLNHSSDQLLTSSLVQYKNGYFVASQNWRDNFTSDVSALSPHGPCGTAVAGTTEVDFACCVKSDKLPEEAHSFIRRLHVASWPSTSTLQRIVTGGCHFVAIGAKSSLTESLEWRISFSAAEKTSCSVYVLWFIEDIFKGSDK